MYCKQVNKSTAPELLKSWRSNSKAHPVDLYINDKRVVHMRNWLCKVIAIWLHDRLHRAHVILRYNSCQLL